MEMKKSLVKLQCIAALALCVGSPIANSVSSVYAETTAQSQTDANSFSAKLSSKAEQSGRLLIRNSAKELSITKVELLDKDGKSLKTIYDSAKESKDVTKSGEDLLVNFDAPKAEGMSVKVSYDRSKLGDKEAIATVAVLLKDGAGTSAAKQFNAKNESKDQINKSTDAALAKLQELKKAEDAKNTETKSSSETKPSAESKPSTSASTDAKPSTETKPSTSASEDTKPADVTKPSETTKPSSEVKPSADTKPSTSASETTKPADVTKPSETTKPSAEVKPSVEIKPSTSSSEATKPADVTKPAETTKPSAETRPSTSASTETKPSVSKETKSSAEVKPSAETKPSVSKETKTSDTTKPSTDTKPSVDTKPSNETKPSAETKPSTDATKPSTETKPSAETKPSEETKPSTQTDNANSKVNNPFAEIVKEKSSFDNIQLDRAKSIADQFVQSYEKAVNVAKSETLPKTEKDLADKAVLDLKKETANEKATSASIGQAYNTAYNAVKALSDKIDQKSVETKPSDFKDKGKTPSKYADTNEKSSVGTLVIGSIMLAITAAAGFFGYKKFKESNENESSKN